MTTHNTVAGYGEFLAARDGEPDLVHHTLSQREAFFAELARHPLHSVVHVDRDVYRRNVVRRRPEQGLDDRMLWLLATAKANQAERFAIGLTELYGLVVPDQSDRVRLHIHLQEHYHTRILADVVALFGLPVHAHPPALLPRALINLLVSTPERWHLPLTGASEMAGCVMFRALRDCGLELFSEEPAITERMRLLFNEILGDEIGHVGFIAAQLGPAGRTLMRALYRLLGRRLASQLPEMVALFGRQPLARQFTPFRLEAMLAECPGVAYAAQLI